MARGFFFGKEINCIIIINFKLRTQEKILLTNLITFYFEANILSF